MSHWWCCCKRPCKIIADDFNRPNSTDLGADWTEPAGDSSIAGNELEMPAGAIVRTVIAHPVDTPTGYARIVIRQPMEVGDIYRVLLNVSKTNPPSYVFAQYEITGTTTGTLSVGSSSGGIANSVSAGQTDLETDSNLTICRTVEGVFGGWGPASTTAWACIADPGGRHAGIMNASSTNTIRVDDFTFEETTHTNDPPCKACDCECEGECLPDELILTIVASECCVCMDGETITLTRNSACLPDFVWSGAKTVCSWDYCWAPNSHDFEFALICKPGNGPWELGVILQAPCQVDRESFTRGCPPNIREAIFSTQESCNPMILTFPNINCFGSPPPPDAINCDHHFVVTLP